MDRRAARRLVNAHSQANPAIPRATPNRRAAPGSTRCRGRGRRRVRRITTSMSRSNQLLMALAPPADNVPPTSVATTDQVPGHPSAASTMAGRVVMSSNSMMRGLVSATYAAHRPPPAAGGETMVTAGASTRPQGTGRRRPHRRRNSDPRSRICAAVPSRPVFGESVTIAVSQIGPQRCL